MAENVNWKNCFKAIGPGILLLPLWISGSPIVSPTQAGAKYGWQLVIVILLVNLFKYPFFHFGSQYILQNNESLIEYYSKTGRDPRL
nr:hypothetical protein [Streptococcus halotolerans]